MATVKPALTVQFSEVIAAFYFCLSEIRFGLIYRQDNKVANHAFHTPMKMTRTPKPKKALCSALPLNITKDSGDI